MSLSLPEWPAGLTWPPPPGFVPVIFLLPWGDDRLPCLVRTLPAVHDRFKLPAGEISVTALLTTEVYRTPDGGAVAVPVADTVAD